MARTTNITVDTATPVVAGVALLVVLATILPSCAASRLAANPELHLEIDAFECLSRGPVTEYGADSVKQALAQANIDVILDKATIQGSCSVACVNPKDVDGLLKSTASSQPAHRWYTHGLMIPECCQDSYRSLNTLPALCGRAGSIWFVQSWFGDVMDSTSLQRIRRDFILLDINIPSKQDALFTIIHETAHILNAHHCEYGPDSGSLSKGTLEHLAAHRKTAVSYVEPGKENKEFCEILEQHRRTLHDGCADCEIDDEAEPIVGIELVVATEFSEDYVFLPGEPFRVNVTLKPDSGLADPVMYYGEPSLDPTRGYLWLSAGDPDPDPNVGCDRPLQRLGHPVHVEPYLDPVPLTERVTAVGIDAWASLPVLDRDVCLRASYAGFPTSGTSVAHSEPITIRVAPGPVDPVTFANFTAREARRFLFLFGGDHLEDGRRKLEDVARVPDSRYSPYAALALGMSLAQPYVSYDRATGSLSVREEKPVEAANRYLDPLWKDSDGLPPSYMLHLNDARAVAHELLGDAAGPGNPAVARHHYEIALAHRKTVSSKQLPRPPTMTPEEAERRANADVQRIDEKIGGLSPP